MHYYFTVDIVEYKEILTHQGDDSILDKLSYALKLLLLLLLAGPNH